MRVRDELAQVLEAHAGVNLTAGWEGSPDPTNWRNIRRVCKCGALIGREGPPPKRGSFRLGGYPFDAPHREHIADVLAHDPATPRQPGRPLPESRNGGLGDG